MRDSVSSEHSLTNTSDIHLRAGYPAGDSRTRYLLGRLAPSRPVNGRVGKLAEGPTLAELPQQAWFPAGHVSASTARTLRLALQRGRNFSGSKDGLVRSEIRFPTIVWCQVKLRVRYDIIVRLARNRSVISTAVVGLLRDARSSCEYVCLGASRRLRVSRSK